MSNEIKQGDKVRVSKEVPKLYTMYGQTDWESVESTVEKIDGDAAEIKHLNELSDEFDSIAIPCKYLVKVDAEAKEAKFKVGDRVCVKGCGYEPNLHKGDIGEILDTNDKEQCFVLFKKSQAWIYADCLEPYTEPTTPTIKVGADWYEYANKQVWNCKSHKHGIIKRIIDGAAEVFTEYGEHKVWPLMDLVDEYDEPFEKWKSTEPTEQTGTEKKPNVGSIKIPVEVDLSDSYWDAYAADLAKELALKVANKYNDPEQAAEYAVLVAKAVVEGLKRK